MLILLKWLSCHEWTVLDVVAGSQIDCTFLTKVCWTTSGAVSILETKAGLLERPSSSEAGILLIDSEGTPVTSVPIDSREDPVVICLTHSYIH